METVVESYAAAPAPVAALVAAGAVQDIFAAAALGDMERVCQRRGMGGEELRPPW